MELITNNNEPLVLNGGVFTAAGFNSGSSQMTFAKHTKTELFFENETAADTNASLECKLEDGAIAKFVIFDLHQADSVVNKYHFDLSRDSHLDVIIISMNSNKTNTEVTVNLNESGAESNVNVISVAGTDVDANFNIICNNYAPHTSTNISQRAVAFSGGVNRFTATGFIAEDCSKAKNFQESRVLLLDEASLGEASPILLINHHDVEAGHAAGVSRVDQEEMYYLMSRGIDRYTAERLMTVAFIRPIIDQIDDEEHQTAIFEKINSKVNDGDK